MPKNPPAPLTTQQAIERARRILGSGQALARAADSVSETRNGPAQAAAEVVKEHELLKYRVNTIPSALAPVLEALILAASNGADVSRELQHAAL